LIFLKAFEPFLAKCKKELDIKAAHAKAFLK